LENDATVTSGDKGNSIVILPIQQHNSKIQNFVDKNNFQTSATNPTTKFQNQIRKTVNHSSTLIPQCSKWKYINLNPSAPTIKGLIKLHQPDQPTRPIANWRSAPAYNLSRLFTSKIKQIAPLPYSFNVRNTTDLIHELQHTPITPTSTFASLDIKNMYSNIPVAETKQILDNALAASFTDPHAKCKLLNWYEIITKQNYFQHNNQIIVQTDGLATGAPSSSLLSEIFLQQPPFEASFPQCITGYFSSPLLRYTYNSIPCLLNRQSPVVLCVVCRQLHTAFSKLPVTFSIVQYSVQ
jgi:hypothetical protein